MKYDFLLTIVVVVNLNIRLMSSIQIIFQFNNNNQIDGTQSFHVDKEEQETRSHRG